MIDKIKEMTPQQRKRLSLVSIIIIILMFLLFSLSFDRKDKERFLSFSKDFSEAAEAYGDTIEKINFENNYVAVYVNTDRWNASSEETKKAFCEEIVGIANSIAKDNKAKDILFSIYSSKNTREALYQINGN